MASIKRALRLVIEMYSSKAIASADRLRPSAPPMLDINMFSTFEQEKKMPSTHDVYTKATEHTRPTPAVRFSGLGDNVSAFAPHREFKDIKRVRPTNFQKWVKKFNGLGDPYDHLANLNR